MAHYFDEVEAQRLYKQFTEHGDKAALDSLIQQCVPLARYNAVRIAPGQHERIQDLTQIGLMRVLELLHERRYVPGRGKLFPFLASCSYNKMVDSTRLAEDSHQAWSQEAEDVATVMEIPPDNAMIECLRQQ